MFIYTELLLKKHDDLGVDTEILEVPFVFNTDNIVTARPVIDDTETPIAYRRKSVVTLTDGNTYMLKQSYAEIISWIDPSNTDGNVLNSYPTSPTLDVAN